MLWLNFTAFQNFQDVKNITHILTTIEIVTEMQKRTLDIDRNASVIQVSAGIIGRLGEALNRSYVQVKMYRFCSRARAC